MWKAQKKKEGDGQKGQRGASRSGKKEVEIEKEETVVKRRCVNLFSSVFFLRMWSRGCVGFWCSCGVFGGGSGGSSGVGGLAGSFGVAGVCVGGACFSVVCECAGSGPLYRFLMMNLLYRSSLLAPECVKPSSWKVKEI